MAKRKKATAKPAASRRSTRRSKQPNDESAAVPEIDGETSAAVNIPPSDQSELPQNLGSSEGSEAAAPVSSENSTLIDSQTSSSNATKNPHVQIVALHKKFGKYRLFNSDETFARKYEVGSDSETNSSVEVRVVDPCASSESDSNAGTESQSDTNSRACPSPVISSISVTQSQSSSRDISPAPVMPTSPAAKEHMVVKENVEAEDKMCLDTTPAFVPVPPDLNEQKSATTEQTLSEKCEDIPIIENIPTEDFNHSEQIDFGGEDDEVITIVQIVEDDNPELYYSINIDSPKDHTLSQQDLTEYTNKKQEDVEKHFEKLNIVTSEESIVSPMEYTESHFTPPVCITPDLPFPKENINENLVRPDPSLTPSSTLSDDSNSSRITEAHQNNSNDSAESSPTGVRRSSRIKTISNLKQKTKGYGLVKTPLKKALITQTKLKLEEIGSDSQEKPSDASFSNAPNSPSFPVPSDMPVKVKSRWRRSSELEMGASSPANSPLASPSLPQRLPTVSEAQNLEEEQAPPLSKEAYDRIIDERMKQYLHLDENEYLCERMISKETKKMICDCFMTKEELDRGELACGEDCLNRLLMIECNSRCPVGDRCTNRRFQKRENAPLKVFYADKKGCGVEAELDITAGEFLMEYVGEVLDYDQFYKRAQAYSDENNLHHYFMSLKGDTVIDATSKGNISRFINHSCEPNAETQKWTVNGELRIGFFSKRDIVAGEEITFDYQFQRFGKVAQRCYCGAHNCRGWIGAEPDSDDEYDEEEEDVSTSKSGADESSAEAGDALPAEAPRPRKPKRERKYKPKADLVQDADIEEELELLGRTGIKNQSHTLRLSRTVVRAKSRRAQVALLRLLRDAHLPCRRLFLDYRGLRLLAPWCNDAPLDFRLEMLQTVDRLPITNKTMVQESRFFTIVERWLSAADQPEPNLFIDEATGLPVELPNSSGSQEADSPDKSKDNAAMNGKVKDLCNQLLERWASLKEVFKIPKKERIQQMKEHERQANVERRAADSTEVRDRDRGRERDRDRDRDRDRREDRDRDRDDKRDRDRDRDRDRHRERERDRERERERERDRDRDREKDRDRDDRDRRKRRSSPEGRRSIRLSERVLAAVPPMSKEERRRAFAEAAAAADTERRRPRDWQPQPAPYWPHDYQQMFQGGMPMGGMMPGMMPDMPPEWMQGADFQPFCQPFPGAQPFCMPQPNMMGMSGFGMPGFMFGQQMPNFPPGQQLADAMSQVPGAVPGQNLDMPAGMMPNMPNMPLGMAPGQSLPGVPAAGSADSAEEPLLPSMWRSAVDNKGRRYYYHVKLRQPQWAPPTPPPPPSPDDSSEEEEEEQISAADASLAKRKGKMVEGVNGIYEVIKEDTHNGLIPDHALVSVKPRKRRPGLVSERPISPRTEEDKLAGRMEVKRYKQTKEKLRRRRERMLHKMRLAASKQDKQPLLPDLKMVDLVDSDTDSDDESDEEKPIVVESSPVVVVESPVPAPVPVPVPVVPALSGAEAEEVARRKKEQFRSSMARAMVSHLNPYRHDSAPVGRITCTADFKHLARKLTHFVMLKELKHCQSVEELVVTDSVRSKAKMFVKKYMAKFGPVYKRPPEEAD